MAHLSRTLLFITGICGISVAGFTQKTIVVDSTTTPGHVTVIAGKQYDKSSLHQRLWGKHYREDWATPVKVEVMLLDTVDGGLLAYQKGGGRQSKTIRLKNAAGKEYVLRSIDKKFGLALPEIYRGTFIETIINDQVSIAEPYAALTIPEMAKAADINHTIPRIVFIPHQKALGEFNDEYGNNLYLFEQRPDDNWEEASNFANSKKIIGTEKMLEKIWEENDRRPDQLAYVKARLFDMFLGDWGRHEDQWRWAEVNEGNKKLYAPIPRDRDQVFTKFDGMLLSLVISAAGVGHLETFGPNMSNVATYNFPARNLDRQIANEPNRPQWINIAKELQLALTDKVIEEGIKNLPPEIYPISGEKIISTLKARRDNLVDFATDYYDFLAKEVEIVGTKENEYFEIKKITATETVVNIYDLDEQGKIAKEPYYSRTFLTAETKEIRVYGLAGKDQFKVDDKAKNSLVIRIIGGGEKDNYQLNPTSKVHVYDNEGNDFTRVTNTKKHLSDNPFVHAYRYDAFQYDSRGFSPRIFYSSEDHFYVGLDYQIEKKKWRKHPYGSKHELSLKYSLSEKAFSLEYEGLVKQLIGNWDLALNALYDFMRWNNYFGIGNETDAPLTDRNFNRVRSKEFLGSIGIQKTFATHHKMGITGFFQGVTILHDPERFLYQSLPIKPPDQLQCFAGAVLDYNYQNVDDVIVPSRGIKFLSSASYTQNLEATDSAVARISGSLNVFIPLSRSFVFSIKPGGATLSGNPEFYQLSRLGSSKTLRGFRKYRFHGTSMAYVQNELQFIKDVKSYLYSGKFGLLALYDVGRVWQPGEKSDKWHMGYGGGIILAPFNKISIALMYAVSKNEKDFSLRCIKPF